MKNSAPKKGLRRWRLHILAIMAVLIAVVLGYWCNLQFKRDSEDFDFWLSKNEVEDDLDELEWLLENRYSYLELKGVDYSAALDSIRASLGDGINRLSFGYRLTKLMALFGDGHSRVASPSVQLKSLCSEFLPFLVEESNGRLVVFKPDRSNLLDPNYPFLRALDGLPVDSWLQAAGLFVARGSPQYFRCHTIRNLRYIECLRKELGLRKTGAVGSELESANGSSTKQIELLLVKKCPVYGFWPRPETDIKSLKDVRVKSRILQPNIGYLRFVGMSAEPEFLNELVETMNRLAQTDGLIIDIRTNGGGRRAPLRALFPIFMAEKDSPCVVNVAAYRLETKDIKEDFEARYLHPASWPHWSEAERAAITQFAATFQPEWVLPQGQFSEWHYFVLSPCRDRGYFHYDKPVVILMDQRNFSACDIFLGAFKGKKSVTLMGLPSGGGSSCRQKYRLSNSQIRIHLSSMASFQPNGKLYDGNGIQPDVAVEPLPTDFIGRTDTVIERAIEHINKKNNSLHL